jgi:hypothetical protein
MTYEIAERARRRTQRAVIIGVLVVALLAALFFVLTQVRSDSNRAVGAPGSPGAGPTGAPASGQPVPGSSAAPGEAGDVRMELGPVGQALPVSPSAGPSDTSDGLARGFAHNRLGAALAAVHISNRAQMAAGSAIFEPTMRDQVVGFYTPALLQEARTLYKDAVAQLDMPAGGPLVAPTGSEFYGYRLLGYSDDSATVDILVMDTTVDGALPELVPTPSGTPATREFISLKVQVRWQRGDWRLEAPDQGSWVNARTIHVRDVSNVVRFPAKEG